MVGRTLPFAVAVGLLACSGPPASRPAPPRPATTAPAPVATPAAPPQPDPAWDVAGIWDAGALEPGCALSLLRFQDGGVNASLTCAGGELSDIDVDATVDASGLHLVALRDGGHEWSFVCTAPGPRALDGADGTGRTVSLPRWRGDEVAILPSEAVVRAVSYWAAQHPEPAVVEHVQESSDQLLFGSGTRRTWVVGVENPHRPGTAVMPATLDVDVDTRTGAVLGISGR